MFVWQFDMVDNVYNLYKILPVSIYGSGFIHYTQLPPSEGN